MHLLDQNSGKPECGSRWGEGSYILEDVECMDCIKAGLDSIDECRDVLLDKRRRLQNGNDEPSKAEVVHALAERLKFEIVEAQGKPVSDDHRCEDELCQYSHVWLVRLGYHQ